MKKLLLILLLSSQFVTSNAQRLWRTPGSQEWRDSLEAWGNERWAPVSGGGIAWGGITGTISLQSDLMALFGTKIDTSAIGFHFRAAINAGNAPSLANPFATMADLGGSETDPVFTTWLGTNDYLSSSTTSTQDGYFRRIYLKDAVNPSHYLSIIIEDDLTASRTLNINLGDASRTLTLAGNATISGTNTGDQVEADPVFDAWLTAIPDLSEFNNDVGFITDLTGFDTGDLTEGANLYFTDERAQDATGTMATDGSLVYVDATPLLTRGALTGAVTAAQGSNTTALGSFTKAQLTTAVSDGDPLYVGDIAGISDGDKGDVAVSSSGAVWTVESTTGAFSRLNAIYPTQITAATHDYNPTGFSAASVIYINSDADTRNITGMIPSGDGDVKTFINNGSFKVIFSNENAGSTANYRFHSSSSFSIPPDNGFVTWQYEGGSMNRWRPIAWNTAAGGDLAGSNYPTVTIANGAVSYAKMQDVSAASRLVGRGSAAGSGDPEEITPGTNLTMSTTTLNAQSVSTSGVGTSPTSSSTQTITHSLGFIPKIIRIYGYGTFTSNAAATATTSSMGIYNSSGNRCVYQAYNTAAITTTQAGASSTTFAISLSTGANNFITGVIGNVTTTQFDIVWTETGTATAQVYMWEAE